MVNSEQIKVIRKSVNGCVGVVITPILENTAKVDAECQKPGLAG